MTRLLLSAGMLLVATLSCAGCAPSAGCQPQIGQAVVQADGAAVRLVAEPSSCSVDFTNDRNMVLHIGTGHDQSARPAVVAHVRADSDGSFDTTVRLPEELAAGEAYATVYGGFDAHATGDVALNVVRFKIPG